MTFLDAKWLDLFEVKAWKLVAVAIAGFLVVAAQRRGWMEPLPAAATQIIVVVSIVCGCLGAAQFVAQLVMAAKKKYDVWLQVRRLVGHFRGHLNQLTPVEREIFSYLLTHNQQIFTAAIDGGHAATLLSLGFVVIAVRPGQHFRELDTPMGVPDAIWEVLQERKSEFMPYVPRGASHPWRKSWMET